MIIFYLIQNTSGANRPLSARKPRIREKQKFTPRTLPRLRGVCQKLGSFYPKKTQAPGKRPDLCVLLVLGLKQTQRKGFITIHYQSSQFLTLQLIIIINKDNQPLQITNIISLITIRCKQVQCGPPDISWCLNRINCSYKHHKAQLLELCPPTQLSRFLTSHS